MVSKDQIRRMGELSKLKFSTSELDEFTEKFCNIVEYVGKINKLELDEVEPTYGINMHTQKFREDDVRKGISKEQVLENAPEEQYGYFKILKIVE